MTEKRDSIGTGEIKEMMAPDGDFAPIQWKVVRVFGDGKWLERVLWSLRRRIGALVQHARSRHFVGRGVTKGPPRALNPSALTFLALFYHHLLMNASVQPVQGRILQARFVPETSRFARLTDLYKVANRHLVV